MAGEELHPRSAPGQLYPDPRAEPRRGLLLLRPHRGQDVPPLRGEGGQRRTVGRTARRGVAGEATAGRLLGELGRSGPRERPGRGDRLRTVGARGVPEGAQVAGITIVPTRRAGDVSPPGGAPGSWERT